MKVINVLTGCILDFEYPELIKGSLGTSSIVGMYMPAKRPRGFTPVAGRYITECADGSEVIGGVFFTKNNEVVGIIFKHNAGEDETVYTRGRVPSGSEKDIKEDKIIQGLHLLGAKDIIIVKKDSEEIAVGNDVKYDELGYLNWDIEGRHRLLGIICTYGKADTPYNIAKAATALDNYDVIEAEHRKVAEAAKNKQVDSNIEVVSEKMTDEHVEKVEELIVDEGIENADNQSDSKGWTVDETCGTQEEKIDASNSSKSESSVVNSSRNIEDAKALELVKDTLKNEIVDSVLSSVNQWLKNWEGIALKKFDGIEEVLRGRENVDGIMVEMAKLQNERAELIRENNILKEKLKAVEKFGDTPTEDVVSQIRIMSLHPGDMITANSDYMASFHRVGLKDLGRDNLGFVSGIERLKVRPSDIKSVICFVRSSTADGINFKYKLVPLTEYEDNESISTGDVVLNGIARIYAHGCTPEFITSAIELIKAYKAG